MNYSAFNSSLRALVKTMPRRYPDLFLPPPKITTPINLHALCDKTSPLLLASSRTGLSFTTKTSAWEIPNSEKAKRKHSHTSLGFSRA